MANRLQHLRGSEAEHSTFTGAKGEISLVTDTSANRIPTGEVRVHDGTTAGGLPLALGTTSKPLTNNIVLSSGVGINFNNYGSEDSNSATTVGSNLLDDYEEGTWTPAFSGATFSTSSVGVYVKVGTLVTVHASISATYSSPISSFKINNLPFTVFNNSVRSGADTVCCQSGITFTGYVTLECIENTTEAYFEDNKSGLSRADMNSSNFASPFAVRFSATYRSST